MVQKVPATMEVEGLTAAGQASAIATAKSEAIASSSVKLAGDVVQVVNTQTGAVATGTTTMPFDDTIPQISEGTEFMTLAITPTSATSMLKIEVIAFLSSSANNTGITVALFQDATADALAAVNTLLATGTGLVTIPLIHYRAAGSTSQITFRVRAGGNIASTIALNGSGGRLLGGVACSSITITEIKV